MKLAKKILLILLFLVAAIDLTELLYTYTSAIFYIENAIYAVLIFSIYLLTVIEDGFFKMRNIGFLLIFGLLAILTLYAKTTLDSGALSSILRFSIPFLLFQLKIVDFKLLIARLIVLLPWLSLLLGTFMMLFGWKDVYRIEYTGVFRLEGAKGAAHLALICIPAILLILFQLSHRFSKKMVYFGIATTLLLCLSFTRTPTALILLILTVFLWNRIHLKKYRNLLFVSFIAVIALVFTQGERVYKVYIQRSITKTGVFNDSGRGVVWQLFANKIAAQPYIGYGGGESTRYLLKKSNFFRSPHNEFLHYAFDYGIFGLLFIIGILINIINRVPFKEFRFFLYLTLVVLSITDNTLSTLAFQVPFFLLVNLLINFDE